MTAGERYRVIRRAATSGSLPAIVHTGHLLLEGHGVARDEPAAFRWFKIAADAGDADGANMVGRCFELGLGVRPDIREAARFYRIAADAAHGWGMFNLAALYLADGGDANRRAALSLLVRSARLRNPKAMNMIGRYREEGWGVRPDPRAARAWYERAARGGCFRGQFHTGRFALMDGEIDTAAAWFCRSMEAAPADYCREAAVMLLTCPATQIREVGMRALERACASGEAQDFHAFGKALASGMPRSAAERVTTLKWLVRAYRAGFDDPENVLAELLRNQEFLKGLGLRWWLIARLHGLTGSVPRTLARLLQ